jgi:hypothetical protein
MSTASHGAECRAPWCSLFVHKVSEKIHSGSAPSGWCNAAWRRKCVRIRWSWCGWRCDNGRCRRAGDPGEPSDIGGGAGLLQPLPQAAGRERLRPVGQARRARPSLLWVGVVSAAVKAALRYPRCRAAGEPGASRRRAARAILGLTLEPATHGRDAAGPAPRAAAPIGLVAEEGECSRRFSSLAPRASGRRGLAGDRNPWPRSSCRPGSSHLPPASARSSFHRRVHSHRRAFRN